MGLCGKPRDVTDVNMSSIVDGRQGVASTKLKAGIEKLV